MHTDQLQVITNSGCYKAISKVLLSIRVLDTKNFRKDINKKDIKFFTEEQIYLKISLFYLRNLNVKLEKRMR